MSLLPIFHVTGNINRFPLRNYLAFIDRTASATRVTFSSYTSDLDQSVVYFLFILYCNIIVSRKHSVFINRVASDIFGWNFFLNPGD